MIRVINHGYSLETSECVEIAILGIFKSQIKALFLGFFNMPTQTAILQLIAFLYF